MTRHATNEPLWWRIFWPAAVALFFALGLVALGLDVLLVVQAAAR